MKEENDSEVVIITCKYHNGRNGYHNKYSYKERKLYWLLEK